MPEQERHHTMLVCHPEQIFPPYSPSKQRSDLSGCFGVFAGAGTTQEQLCFGMPDCCCNERRLQANQLPPLSRRRSMREGSRAQKLARPAERRPGRRSGMLLASSRMKLQRCLPPVSSTYLPLRGRRGFGARFTGPQYMLLLEIWIGQSVTALPRDPRTRHPTFRTAWRRQNAHDTKMLSPTQRILTCEHPDVHYLNLASVKR